MAHNHDIAAHYNRALDIIRARDSQVKDCDLKNRKARIKYEHVISKQQQKQDELRARSMNDILEQFESGHHIRVESILNPDNPMYDRIMRAARAINAPIK